MSSHGQSGVTARLLPFTVDGLIWAASKVVLDASRRDRPLPRLAAWSLGAGTVATTGANLIRLICTYLAWIELVRRLTAS